METHKFHPNEPNTHPGLSKTSPLGTGLPPTLPHAVSVSLPTWNDVVGYEEGDPRVVNAMKTGYPRFFIHRSIQKLASICEQKFGTPISSTTVSDTGVQERCLLFSVEPWAQACRKFILCQDPSLSSSVRLAHFIICAPSADEAAAPFAKSKQTNEECVNLYVVLFPSQSFPLAKSFWQHTGTGISSRLAEHCLRVLLLAPEPVVAKDESMLPVERPMSLSYGRGKFGLGVGAGPIARNPGGRNRHYRTKSSKMTSPTSPTKPSSVDCGSPPVSPNSSVLVTSKLVTRREATEDEAASLVSDSYLEERYARNLPATGSSTDDAKRTVRRRIATILGRSGKTAKSLSEDDVYLFPTGMCAIWHSHQLLLRALGEREAVCFGFPYTDTLKVLQKWGPGCHFFGFAHSEDLEALEALLRSRGRYIPSSSIPPSPPTTPTGNGRVSADGLPILALYCEMPSNPLLCSHDLRKLRSLADEYGFIIVVDETIGNFANLDLLPWADILVSSLTKMFSGETNVMGGGLILNPAGKWYNTLKHTLKDLFVDGYYGEDSIYLERNSRDFQKRVYQVNENTEAICDFLRSESLEALGAKGDEKPVIKKVYYPKYVTSANYEAHMLSPASLEASGLGKPGYGFLFSLTFTSMEASQAFFNNLGCEKGPSLGTNFTLACPYTLLAHYTELDWAAEYGVEPGLIRISVGLEDRELLFGWMKNALEAAKKAVRQPSSTPV